MFVIDQRVKTFVAPEEIPESARKPVRPLGMIRDKSPNDPIFPVIDLQGTGKGFADLARRKIDRNAAPIPAWNLIPNFKPSKS